MELRTTLISFLKACFFIFPSLFPFPIHQPSVFEVEWHRWTMRRTITDIQLEKVWQNDLNMPIKSRLSRLQSQPNMEKGGMNEMVLFPLISRYREMNCERITSSAGKISSPNKCPTFRSTPPESRIVSLANSDKWDLVQNFLSGDVAEWSGQYDCVSGSSS